MWKGQHVGVRENREMKGYERRKRKGLKAGVQRVRDAGDFSEHSKT